MFRRYGLEWLPTMERSRPHAYQWEVWAALAAYLALLTTSFLAGYQVTVPWDYFQFLPQRELIDNLAESLYSLHAQPPLMNLELGLSLILLFFFFPSYLRDPRICFVGERLES